VLSLRCCCGGITVVKDQLQTQFRYSSGNTAGVYFQIMLFHNWKPLRLFRPFTVVKLEVRLEAFEKIIEGTKR
jgi:hypothetical protein